MKKTNPAFRERLHVPLRWWIQGGLMAASFWIAMIVAIPEYLAWSISAFLTALLALGLRTYGGARIVLQEGSLRAGRARIDLEFVGLAHPLDRVQTRAMAGPLADARAYLLLRPYLPQGVRVEIDDPDDPTPYWLLSSRRPESLAASLNDGKHG